MTATDRGKPFILAELSTISPLTQGSIADREAFLWRGVKNDVVDTWPIGIQGQ